MLHKETISTSALELLIDLMHDNNLKDFFLVGGTALSLTIGHRTSIDLDLFSINPFNENKLLEYLEKSKSLQLDFLDKNTIKGQIGDVKVDFITHSYSIIKKIKASSGIRMASIQDISAMKLNAIVGNGTRLKDFIDVAFMSAFLSLGEMLKAYQTKYKTRNEVMVLKSLNFYGDINHLEPINLISCDYSWMPIKQRIDQMLNSPDEVFEPMDKDLKKGWIT